jgi:autotransporter adhesin
MVDASSTQSGPVPAKPMVNTYSKNILKRVVGNERALNAFQSISMGAIPKANSFNSSAIDKSASLNLI